MKTKNIILIIVFALLVGGGWWFVKTHQITVAPLSNQTQHDHKDIYYCPMHPQVKSDKPGICPICQMKLVKKENNPKAELQQQISESKKEKKILYYRNPMDPSITSPTFMKDSMGMDYIPVYDESNTMPIASNSESVTGYSTVAIDTQKQQIIGIKTAPVMKKILTKTIHAYGYVAHDLELYDAQLEYIDAWRIYYAFQSRRPITDQFRTDWREYYIKEPSQGRWRSDEKVKAQQRLIKAEYELRHMGLTDAQLTQLRKIKYGEPWVQPDLVFFDKDQPFWVYAQVLENDLGFIAPGQKVMATIPVYKETIEGVVKSIAPLVDPETRTSRVRIELPSYKGELSVNMYVNVDMPVELDDSLVVPRNAIMDTGLSQIVFVQSKTQEGVFEPRKITTGFEGDGMVAVKSGLKEGEMIVTSGNFLLDSESRLQGSLAAGGQ